MSKSFRLIFLVAILGLVGSRGNSNPSDWRFAPSFSPTLGEKFVPTVWATTSGTAHIRLSDIPVGKVIQVGQVKFVKVGADQYLAVNLCPEGSTYDSYFKGCKVKTTPLSYTGNYQTFTAPDNGYYVFELWGASGNYDAYTRPRQPSWDYLCGYGGYTAGVLPMNKNEQVYVYIGQQGIVGTETCNTTTGMSWNGGGSGISANDCSGGGSGGGGATDVRLTSGAWNNATSLRSRIMVAGAGGGGPTIWLNLRGSGSGGGLQSVGDYLYSWSTYQMTNNSYATQTTGHAFGYGQDGVRASGTAGGAGGGGGYWGGKNTTASTTVTGYQDGGAGGGSSYISGHTGCVAIASASSTSPKSGCSQGTANNSCSIHYSGKYFMGTRMIDGLGYEWTNTKGGLSQMPSPTSVGTYYSPGVGHMGNGAARITQLSVYLGI